MSTTQEVLAKIFDSKTVFLEGAGRDVALKKITVRTLGPVVKLLAEVMADLKLDGGNMPALNLGASPDAILKLISNHYDQVVELVPLFSNLTAVETLELDPADGLTIVQAIILLNQDFFTKRVLPALELSKTARAATV